MYQKEEPKPKETAKQKSKYKKPTVPVKAEVIDINSLQRKHCLIKVRCNKWGE